MRASCSRNMLSMKRQNNKLTDSTNTLRLPGTNPYNKSPTTRAYVLITTPHRTKKSAVSSSPKQNPLTLTVSPSVKVKPNDSIPAMSSPMAIGNWPKWDSQSFHGSSSQNTSSEISSASMYTSQPSQGHQISRVHTFLDSCIPPMSGYLQRFIDFGCETEVHLLAISLWTDAEIDELLKDKLPPGPEGMHMSDMNVLCLRRHFRTYFEN